MKILNCKRTQSIFLAWDTEILRVYILYFHEKILWRWIPYRTLASVLFFTYVLSEFSPQSTVYLVPEFLAGRLSWLPPPPPTQTRVAPPRNQVGRHTIAWGKGMGEPMQTKGQTLWYFCTVYSSLLSDSHIYRYNDDIYNCLYMLAELTCLWGCCPQDPHRCRCRLPILCWASPLLPLKIQSHEMDILLRSMEFWAVLFVCDSFQIFEQFIVVTFKCKHFATFFSLIINHKKMDTEAICIILFSAVVPFLQCPSTSP